MGYSLIITQQFLEVIKISLENVNLRIDFRNSKDYNGRNKTKEGGRKSDLQLL